MSGTNTAGQITHAGLKVACGPLSHARYEIRGNDMYEIKRCECTLEHAYMIGPASAEEIASGNYIAGTVRQQNKPVDQGVFRPKR